MKTSANTGYIRSPDADTVQEALWDRLAQGAENCDEEVGRQFQVISVYSDGALKLWCQAKATIQWTEDALRIIRLSSVESLSLKKGKEAPLRIVCGLLILSQWEEACQIDRILK